MGIFKPEIVAEFERVRPDLESILPGLKRELRSRLVAAGVVLHRFSARIKRPDSLLQKISRPDRTYSRVWDITDLIGLRIVTGFEDSIDDVARVIESHYDVDLMHSRNRLQYDDHERFGYRSLHYVCALPAGLGMPPRARFEIQVRTALQDVWAEIEHDLGYKASELAPSILRRRFSRLASLLEIADEELVAIKADLRRYVNDRRDHSALDLVTLEQLLRHPEVARADANVAEKLDLPAGTAPFYPDYLLRALSCADLTTVQETISLLAESSGRIADFVPVYFRFAREALAFNLSSLESVPCGYSLLFLAHLRVLESEPLAVNRVRRLARFYRQLDYPDDERQAWDVAGALVRTVDGECSTLRHSGAGV